MKNKIKIAKFKSIDADRIAKLFDFSVHHIATKYYTEDQKNTWAKRPINYQFWQQRLSSNAKQT